MTQNDQNPSEYMRVAELAAILKIHKNTLYKWVRDNQFPKPIKVNGVTLFKSSDVMEYLDEAERK